MKVFVIARGPDGYAESWASDLQRKSGVSCQGRTFAVGDESEAKLKRASASAGLSHIADAIEQAMLDDFEFRRSRIVLVGSASSNRQATLPKGLIATDATYWNHLVALLVLIFPDIHWLFATTRAEDERMAQDGLGRHSLPANGAQVRLPHIVALRDDGYEPLFDPTGLRNLVKRQSFERLDVLTTSRKNVDCPARDGLVLILDDEVEVATAVAYLHYRQGYRALTVTSEYQMLEARHAGSISQTAESFVIEFVDSSAGHQDLRPSQRHKLLSTLENVPDDKRIVYTIDDIKGHNREDCQGVRVISSPFDGMTDLLEQFGLSEKPDSFVWPPANREREKTAGRHAVRGFLTSAARRLLQRAGDTTQPAHRRAMFAIEAQELLLNRLPSLSLSAHRQRLAAELQIEDEVPTIFGASAKAARVRLRPRFAEIDAEIASMRRVIYSKGSSRRGQLSRALKRQLIGSMIDGYRRGYHFHEELASITQQRDTDMRGAYGYVALMLRRPRNLILSVMGSVAFFAAAYVMVAIVGGKTFSWSLVERTTMMSFYTLASVGAPLSEMIEGTELSKNHFYHLLVTLECIVGLFHWGLGFAHLYTLASRR